MPTARSGFGVTVVNGKIYAIGGSNSGGYLRIVEEYNPATNTWTTKAIMPTARCDLKYAEKTVIDSVIQNFCCYSGKILERFTHSEMPWLKTRGSLPTNAYSNRIISKEAIGEYFTAVKQKYNMLTPNDIENYAQIMFNRSMRSFK